MDKTQKDTWKFPRDRKEKGTFYGEYVFNEVGTEKEIKLTTQFHAEKSMEFLSYTFWEAEYFFRNKKRKKGAFRECVLSVSADVIDSLGNEYEVHLIRKDYSPIVRIGRYTDKPLLNGWKDNYKIK